MFAPTFFFTAILLQNVDPARDTHQFKKPISLTERASPIKVALDDLSLASGVSLHAAEVIQSEVVLVRLRSVPLGDAMERLARACGGEWSRRSDGFYLSRPAKFEGDLARREKEFVLKRVAQALGDLRRSMASQKPFDVAAAEALAQHVVQLETEADHPPPIRYRMADVTQIEGETPAGRFASQVVALLDPATVASVPPGERRVFSTSPTSMELPLNLDLRDLADRFTAEQAIWTDVASKSIHPPASGTYHIFADPERMLETKPLNRQLAKVIVIVRRNADGVGMFASVSLVDSANEEVALTGATINFADLSAPTVPPLATDSKSPNLVLTKQERQLAASALAGDVFGVRSSPVIDADVAEFARHPDRNEPLGSYVSTMVLQAAEAQNLNVVADVPDSLLRTLASIVGTKGENTSTVLMRLQNSRWVYESPVRLEKGFLEIDGASLLGTQRFRADRKLLALVLSSNPGGDPQLEVSLDYIRSGGMRPYDATYGSLAFAATGAQAIRNNSTVVDYGEVLGMIKAARGDLALHDFGMPVSALAPEVVAAINRLVFFKDSPLRFRFVFTSDSPTTPPKIPRGIAADPCELFPEGLPKDATVALAMHRDQAVEEAPAKLGSRIRFNQQFMGPQEFAARSRGSRQRFGDDSNEPPKYRLFNRQVGSFSLNITQMAEKACDFQATTPASNDYVSYEELPNAFKDAVQRVLDSYRQN